jgi:D-aminoacyl-tRNA deacylase
MGRPRAAVAAGRPVGSLAVRAVVQRVQRAEVRVGGEVVGAIGPGLCALVGVTHDDDDTRAERLAARLAALRIFDDGEGRMNRSVRDVGGAVLVVSQFTLCADTRKGNRPSFLGAAGPEQAEPLVERVVAALRAEGLSVATGRFRSEMAVELVNDGPVTILLEV